MKTSRKLTEAGLMLALSTILSLLKLFELPYGGSITFASMLPMVIFAYRHGAKWGLLAGLANGVIQMLFGLNNLSYATSAAAVVAIICLDYLFAFTSTAIGAAFRNVKSSGAGLAYGALCACVIRYIFHVISGCTVWAGLSIPTQDALLYSLSYNATYMIPETIVTLVAGALIGGSLDFRSDALMPAKKAGATAGNAFGWAASVAAIAAVTAIAVIVFPHLQNAESGEFDVTGLSAVNPMPVIVIATAAAVVIAVCLVIKHAKTKKCAA